MSVELVPGECAARDLPDAPKEEVFLMGVIVTIVASGGEALISNCCDTHKALFVELGGIVLASVKPATVTP